MSRRLDKDVYWIIGLLFVGVYFAGRYIRGRPYDGKWLRMGQVVRSFSVKDQVTGASITILSAPINFVLYFSSSSPYDVEDVAYASYLKDTIIRRHWPAASFVVVTSGIYPQLESMRRAEEMTVPLARDQWFKIAKLLKIPKRRDAFLVLDHSGQVLFDPPGGLVAPQDLRELYERYAFNHITYPQSGITAQALVGTHFPDLLLRQIQSGQLVRLSQVAPARPGKSRYWVFAGGCPICAIDAALRRMTRDADVNARAVPIFSSRFPLVLLRQMAEEAGVTRPLYQSTQEIPGFEDLYFAQTSYANAGLLVTTDETNRILLIQQSE